MRISNYAWGIAFAVAAFGLYHVKYRVQEIKDQVEVVESELHAEQENLRILSAEWAYLNRPERLRSLSEQYLEVVSMSGERVVVLDVLPNTGNHFAHNETQGYVKQSSYLVPTGARE